MVDAARPGKTLIVYTDGAAQPNPGPAAIGVVILDPDGRVVDRLQRGIGRATNNQAEYRALIAGLERARQLGAQRVEVRSDSELLVRQLQGRYRVRDAGLRPLFEATLGLARQFATFSCVHIPREQNLADAPSKVGLLQNRIDERRRLP